MTTMTKTNEQLARLEAVSEAYRHARAARTQALFDARRQDVPVAKIAEAAGVGRGGLYSTFKTLERRAADFPPGPVKPQDVLLDNVATAYHDVANLLAERNRLLLQVRDAGAAISVIASATGMTMGGADATIRDLRKRG